MRVLSVVVAVVSGAALAGCGGAPPTRDAPPGTDATARWPDTREDVPAAPADSPASPADALVPPAGCVPRTAPAGHHVSPAGTATGDGTAARPWDLATALRPAAAIRPGDTVWLHAGVYRGGFVSRLQGATGMPVTLRSYPGEWAVIDGQGSSQTTLQVYRGDAVYQGFEIRNSEPSRAAPPRASAIWLEGPRIKLVNLVIHDTGNVPMYEEAPDAEVYGCLIYNVGVDEAGNRAHGHNAYVQNQTGSKLLAENIVFNGYSFGVHAYAEAGSYLLGLNLIGNIWFGNGAAAAGASTDNLKDNCLVGGTAAAADGIVLRENLGWAPTPTERSVRLGYGVPNGALTLADNYFVGDTLFQQPWSSVTMRGNTFVGPVHGMITPANHPENTYLSAAPTATRVFVRPNRYEPGRANIAVYNWGMSDAVDVDVSSVIAPGTPYEVRNAQNYFAPPVLAGTFDGRPLRLPMTGLDAVQPIGAPSAIAASEMTGRRFNVFVLLPRLCP